MINLREYLEKLRALPEVTKKIILWAIVAILAVVLGFFWVRSAMNNFSKMGESFGKIELPKVDLPAMPSVPDFSVLDKINPETGEIMDNPDLLETNPDLLDKK